MYDDKNADIQGWLSSAFFELCLLFDSVSELSRPEAQYDSSNFEYFIELIIDIPFLNSRNISYTVQMAVCYFSFLCID